MLFWLVVFCAKCALTVIILEKGCDVQLYSLDRVYRNYSYLQKFWMMKAFKVTLYTPFSVQKWFIIKKKKKIL